MRTFRVLGSLSVLLAAGPVAAEQFLVEPYLQYATPTAITVAWETDEGAESRVEWGPALALGRETEGAVEGHVDGQIHTVRLEALEPGTRYYYRAVTGAAASATTHFVTPPAQAAEAFRLVAMSDMQIDRGAPEVFGQIVQDGVIPYVTEHYHADLPTALSMALIPGDLVDFGPNVQEWRGDFFGPARPLLAQVPVYPVPGNHEIDTPHFFQYFVLPPNGTAPWLEHWWFNDYANLRVIGLDSNGLYRTQGQLDWLDQVLGEACAMDEIDFVFAQLHHPHLSELWPDGELNYTGEIIERMEAFTTACGKPSLHFFGHTHGYSRGQSRDHQHLWVNVASAGGNLDRWGEYAQHDYDEFVVSQDEYGFVIAEVVPGEAPEFRLTRVGMGKPGARTENTVRDQIRVRRYGAAPARPAGYYPTLADEPVNPDCFELAATAFADPDGDAHQGAHWQISGDCEDFEALVYERWRQAHNWYFEIDTQAGDDLTDERITHFAPEATACWRVRYRDEGLAWGPWSAPVPFRTGPSALSDNLLQNPGAEQGLEGWRVLEGNSESMAAGECQGAEPASGDRYFAVGGVCDSSAYAELAQRVPLAPFAEVVTGGVATVSFGAMMRDYNGSDQPAMQLRFVGAEDAALGETPWVGSGTGRWLPVDASAAIPPAAVAIDVVLGGTRNAGQDNDSYIDDVFMRVSGDAPCDEAPVAPAVIPDAGVDPGTVDSDLGDASPALAPDAGRPAAMDGTVGADIAAVPVDQTADASDEGCSSGPGAPAPWLALLAALGVVLRRRR